MKSCERYLSQVATRARRCVPLVISGRCCVGYVWRMVEASVLLLLGIKGGGGTRGQNGFQNTIHGEYVLTVGFESLEI